ncbi:fibrobacter succinogenes major paralogous domain-containing protein [Flavobacterium sp.]|uniref:fibrobacter succinogenes major paralogous domain-containing protein n=1 Tax=Flavobacterium sp. TaxID=239 RepID=UPI0012023BF3|nr:fibrobacter succinogenes major paralogous domain-containing protein [Flavobacterium sp.]RZJ70034.1 MAG: hypothetical protein EOO49_15380 [Flavobacterium sp.]
MKKLILSLFFAVLISSCSDTDDSNSNDNTPNLTVATFAASNSTTSQITFKTGGTVTSTGNTVAIQRGICWNIEGNPTVLTNKVSAGTGNGTFETIITERAPDVSYHVRAFAITETDTVYGNDVTLQTKPFAIPGNGVMDECGNNYPTVILADREWMAENLKATCYQNGDAIQAATSQANWTSQTSSQTGIYLNYANSVSNGVEYGKLYSWFAINDARKISPVGWSVPSQADFENLRQYILDYRESDNLMVGKTLKTTATGSWTNDIAGTTNSAGFYALGAGNYDVENNLNLGFQNLNLRTWFWTRENQTLDGMVYELRSSNHQFNWWTKDKIRFAASVRCIKNP